MKYETLAEALSDVDVAKQNPEDYVFLAKVRDKVLNSSEQLQRLIQDYLEDSMFETHPGRLLKVLSERYKGRVVFKKNSFYFEA